MTKRPAGLAGRYAPKNAIELKQPPVTQLEGVELELYNKDSTQYDLIKSAKAQFDANAKTLFSDGDADIDHEHSHRRSARADAW